MATDDEPVAKRTRRAQANDSEDGSEDDGSEDDGSEDDGGDESEDSSARTRLRVRAGSIESEPQFTVLDDGLVEYDPDFETGFKMEVAHERNHHKVPIEVIDDEVYILEKERKVHVGKRFPINFGEGFGPTHSNGISFGLFPPFDGHREFSEYCIGPNRFTGLYISGPLKGTLTGRCDARGRELDARYRKRRKLHKRMRMRCLTRLLKSVIRDHRQI